MRIKTDQACLQHPPLVRKTVIGRLQHIHFKIPEKGDTASANWREDW